MNTKKNRANCINPACRRACDALQNTLRKIQNDHTRQAVTIGLMAVRISELQARLCLDEAAIKHPKAAINDPKKTAKKTAKRKSAAAWGFCY
jgi:hypothetical protein